MMPDWKHRTTEEAREALRRFIDRKPVMTIPVDNERDADCILYDVLEERDALTQKLESATKDAELWRKQASEDHAEVERLKEDAAHWEKQFGHASEHVDELEAKLTGEKDLCIRAIECSSRIGRAMEDCLAAMGRAYCKLEWMKGEDVVDCKSQIKAAGERGRVALRGTVSRDTEKRPCPKCGFWNCEESCLAPGRAAEAKGAENRVGTSPTERPCCVEAYARGYAVGRNHEAAGVPPSSQDEPDAKCFTLPNGECVGEGCKLHPQMNQECTCASNGFHSSFCQISKSKDVEKRVGVPCPHDQGWTMDGDRDICNRCGSRASL